MSHFTVTVLSYSPGDVEDLLAPFCESTDNPDYLEFETASESMEEIRSTYEKEREPDESLNDFVSHYYGYIYNEELDAFGYMCNPNAKWDWWELGGRWRRMLKLKPNCCGNLGEWSNSFSQSKPGYCDQARLKDVDFSLDPEKCKYKSAIRFWEVVVEGDQIREDEDPEQFSSYFNRKYFLEKYKNKEHYAEELSSFFTWALLTPDGEWYEPGEMGWFGMSNESAQNRIDYKNMLQRVLKESDQELWISIVDCHI